MDDEFPLSLSQERLIDDACNQFEEEWRADRRPKIESFLVVEKEPALSLLLRQLLEMDQ